MRACNMLCLVVSTTNVKGKFHSTVRAKFFTRTILEKTMENNMSLLGKKFNWKQNHSWDFKSRHSECHHYTSMYVNHSLWRWRRNRKITRIIRCYPTKSEGNWIHNHHKNAFSRKRKGRGLFEPGLGIGWRNNRSRLIPKKKRNFFIAK